MGKDASGKRKAIMIGKMFRSLLSANTRLIEDVSSDIRVAGSLGDSKFIRYGVSLLGDVVDDSTHLVHSFYEGQAASHRKLGASEGPGRSWDQGTPPEILENMYLIVAHYSALVKGLEDNSSLLDEDQARDLDRRRIQFLREMALRVQIGKLTIVKKDPEFWTSDMERDFKEALEYRLSG